MAHTRGDQLNRFHSAARGHLLWVLRISGAPRDEDACRLILLTDFFAREGYGVIERRTAPQEMQASEEFRLLCPSSAICMAKSLANSV